MVDEVRVYNAALTAADLGALMEAGADPDTDGLTNLREFENRTDPSVNDNGVDSDGDGLSNWAEINVYGTDPFNADSDGDGVSDGAEVIAGTDPLVADQHPVGGPIVTVLYPREGEYILW
jgi:hypothetical protein